MTEEKREPESEVQGEKEEIPKEPPKAEEQGEPTLEQYRELEQKYRTLQGMYNPLKDKHDALVNQGDFAQRLEQRFDAIDRRLDFFEEEREEAELSSDEELEERPSPKKTRIQQKRIARGILADHGLSTTDPQFDEALNRSSDPVKAVSRALAQIRKQEKDSFTQEVAKKMKEAEERIRSELNDERLKREAHRYEGEGGGGTPSHSFQEVEQAYIAGKISLEEYKEARKKQGL